MRLSILILLLPLFGFSQQKMLLDIDDECKRRIQNKINHGIAIATIDSLNNLEFLNYGTENDNGIKVSEKSIFEIASISKTFTSKLMHELVDNNVIQLQQEIREYIPDSLPERVKKITFQELINHTSGLPRLPLNFWASNWDNPYADYTEARFLSDLMTVQLDSTKQWSYSNLGYMLLGYIAEETIGLTSLQQLSLLNSLRNTHLNFNDTLDFTSPHNFGNEVEHWEFHDFNKYVGGIKSSSSDLATYLTYQTKHNQFFSEGYSKQDIIINPNDAIFCRNGWLLFKRENQEIIWHNGISGGFNSFIGYNIQTRTGIVVLSNSQSSIMDIGLHYLSKSFELEKPKKPFINQLQRLIKNDSVSLLKKSWERCDTTLFDKSLGDVYWLQCHYISKKNLKAALALNDILMAEYKDDWEVFYYRAKIYREDRNLKLAKKNYERVDDLFPENNFISNEIRTLPN
jgi:CubicO group peptidase (beta-lactamase class C family)